MDPWDLIGAHLRWPRRRPIRAAERDIQVWADEAERGCDVMRLAGRGNGPAQVVPVRSYVRAAIRSYLA